jgi:ABC-type nitrate/sulfonate/bicarbonate transport system permease component
MTDILTDLDEPAAARAPWVSGDAPGGFWGRFLTAPRWVAGLAGIVVIFILWTLAAVAANFGDAVPTPWSVIAALGSELTQSIYWQAIGHTCLEALEGYLIGNLLALVLAFLILVAPWFESTSTQLAVVTACIPMTAVGPIVALLSPSGGRVTSVFLAAMSVVFTTVIGTQVGLKTATQQQLDVVRAAGGGRFMQLRKVRLVAAVPAILAALKLAAPAAFLGAVLGEYFLIGANSGLGLMLLALQAASNPVKLWAIALLSALIAGVVYALIGQSERLVAPLVTGTAPGRRTR